MPKATGAAAVLGVLVDAPSDLFAIGRPAPDLAVVEPPSIAVASATGGSGLLTGSFMYRCAFGQKDGALTSRGPYDATSVSAPVGTPGLDDATLAGQYIGNAGSLGGVVIFHVIIGATGTPDTFAWQKETSDGLGPLSAQIPVTGSAQALAEGVTVTFGATTGHSLSDAWTFTVTAVPAVATAQSIDLSSIPTSTDAKVDRRVIERSEDGGFLWTICGTIYDNTTATFSDNAPLASLDRSKRLPSVNQTGANYGFVFLEPDAFDLEPDFTYIPVVALLGTAGKPRSIPGPISVMGAPKMNLRPADMLPMLLSGGGLPDSYAQVASEPTQIAIWNATTGKRKARTVSFLAYQGSQDVVPNFLFQTACEEMDFTFTNGKIDDITPKFKGTNYGICAPSVKIAGDGTWKGYFMALGQRYDSLALTDDVYVKITQALSGDVVKFKVKVGSGTSYDGAEYTLYTNPTSHSQTKGGLQFNDGIELADQLGIRLGADVGSNRQPFSLVATAPLTTDLHVNDEFRLPRTAEIPGSGSSPFSGKAARFTSGPRLTDAHVTFTRDGHVVECYSGSVKLMWPKKMVTALCAGARTVQDLPNEGFFAVALTMTRYLDSSENRNIIRTDGRGAIVVTLEGERIPVNPGVLSTHRESLVIALPQVAYASVKAPVPGQVLVTETITADAEQPDDPELDLYTMTLKTRQGWIIPS